MPSSTITSTWPTGSRRRGVRRARLRHEAHRQRQRGEPDRDVDPEDRAPADRRRRARRRAPGPSARLMPTVAPHMPIACARSRGSVKTLRMIDIATGLSIEPPTACSMRKAISQPRLGATLHSSEPSVNSARPDLEHAPAPEPVAHRAATASAGWRARACRRRPSTAGRRPARAARARSTAARR